MHLSAGEGRTELLLTGDILKEVMQSCGVQRKGNEGEWTSSSLLKLIPGFRAYRVYYWGSPCLHLFSFLAQYFVLPFEIRAHTSPSPLTTQSLVFRKTWVKPLLPTKSQHWCNVGWTTQQSHSNAEGKNCTNLLTSPKRDPHFWQLHWHQVLRAGSQMPAEVLDKAWRIQMWGCLCAMHQTPGQPSQLIQATGDTRVCIGSHWH